MSPLVPSTRHTVCQLALAIGISAAGASASAANPDTFVHLFEWSWPDIAAECQTFLGPKGFAAVQVSPPNEHIQGDPWWTRYQPVSYKIFSRSGDAEAFRHMVDTCHAAGVEIYADAVINHTADQVPGPGVAGSLYSRKHHPAIPYGPEDYHGDCQIDDSDYYNNAADVFGCQIGKLPDLNTGLAAVQDRIAAYLRDLATGFGVDGLRVDAAKHIAPGDLRAILDKAGNPWAFLEVIGTPGQVVRPDQYTDLALATDFKYGTDIAGKFRGDSSGNLSQLRTFGDSWGLVPSDRAVVFIDNHDRERGHGGGGNLTYKDGARYSLANIFMLAHPQGYPKIMSGYRFTDTDAGPPAGGGCSNSSWVCQHRWGNIANMVAYRRFAVGACPPGGESRVDHWWTNGSNQIAFGCADKGFVVINNQTDAMSQRLKTGLPAGRYCNILSAEAPCGGEIIEVDAQGVASFNLGAMQAAAIYGGAHPGVPPPGGGGFAHTFDSLFLRGTPNNWSATPMVLVADYTWESQVHFDGRDGQRFKLDVKGDWSQSYGDNQGDRILDPTGPDIYTDVLGDYRLQVSDQTLRYELRPVDGGGGFAQSFEGLFFRGTPNAWGNRAMELVADHIWETEVVFDGGDGQRFKLDVKGDWTHNYGDNEGDRRLDHTGRDIAVPVSGTYRIRVNDQTLEYELILRGAPGPGGSAVQTLGAVYGPERTAFSIWSPDRTHVRLWLAGETHEMHPVPDFNGYSDVYQVTVEGDHRLKRYHFEIDGASVRDPYGRMAEPGAGDSIVLDPARTELPGGWSARPPLAEREDAVIYELHVRDFTIDPSSGVPADRRGKFLGLVERGTSNNGRATGLDHLVELGVTHVQLMPVYDFASCANVADTQCYNWGYDPRNYNVPEERYSLTPFDYENRVVELKRMVDALHKAGLRVIIDVVYNHSADKEMFEPITPRYYTATDLSGTGNSIDAGVPMVGRMIRDSLEYWVREYNVDGFRFDLIGVFDYDDVGAWGRHLNDTFPNRNLLIYGEPWNGFASDPREAHRVRLGTVARIQDAHVGVFNPKYREAIKGVNDSGGCNPGDCYALNSNPDTWRIAVGSRGGIRFANDPTVAIDTWDPMFAADPEQSINYVSAHDNLTLRDKILLWADGHGRSRSDPYLRRVQEFANGVVLTSQGIPFLHSGVELLRDKQGDHNSYQSGDEVNKIRWEWKTANADIFDYYQAAIALRRAHPGLRMNTWEEIDRNVTTTTPRQGVVMHRIQAGANGDPWSEIIVIMNSGAEYRAQLPPGTWRVAMERSAPVAGKGREVSGTVVAEGTAVTLLYRE